MSSIKPILKVDKQKANGEAPLYIRVTKDRKSKYKSLGIYIDPKHWDDQQLKVKKSHPNSARANNLIAKRIADVNGALLELETSSTGYKAQTVFEVLKGKPTRGFLEYSKLALERKERVNSIGMINRTRSVIFKVETYLNGKDMPINEVTIGWVKDYETYLRTKLGNKTNTVTSNMKILSKIMKDAMQEDLIEYGKNPFDRYAFKTEPANIEYLSEAEISAFEEVHLTAESRLEQHRDLYVFACYAAGIRVGDLLRLQWKNFNGESIALITSKTNDPLSIKLGSVALAIVQKQNGRENSEGFIFGLLPADLNLSDRKQVHTAISRATAYLNKNLKIIARKAGINKNIHFHTSRHTWATRALRKGMKYELMSKLLTHRSLTTSQRYAKIVNADLDKAMDVFND